jgi:hypothetical protein
MKSISISLEAVEKTEAPAGKRNWSLCRPSCSKMTVSYKLTLQRTQGLVSEGEVWNALKWVAFVTRTLVLEPTASGSER